MFFSNQFADRNFAAERFLAASHLIAGAAMIALYWTHAFWPFFFFMLVHCLLYVPTISITNSIAFTQMKDAQKEFGIVRMGGTIGWIMAAWPMTFILAQTSGFVDWLGTVLASGLTGPALQAGTRWVFVVAGIASFLLAGFSLTLPHTPPKPVASGANKFAWLEALRLLAAPFILVLWIVTFIDSTVHNLFFNWTGSFLGTPVAAGGVGIPGNWIMPVMSIGQIAEISTMAILGVTLKRFGWRTTMIMGILGHAARFAVFALFPEYKWAIILINVIHGVAYAFFFATVYIFVDEFFPRTCARARRGSST
jgi:MFS family permease